MRKTISSRWSAARAHRQTTQKTEARDSRRRVAGDPTTDGVCMYLLALSRFDDDGCRQQQPPPAQHSVENYARVSLPIYLHKTIGHTRRIVKPNKIVQGQLNRQRQPMSGRFNILIPQRLDTVCVFAVKHSVKRWPKCAAWCEMCLVSDLQFRVAG